MLNWLYRRRVRREEKIALESPPPMPTLPPVRSRPLTAVPCAPSATANSDLFQRIPAEIRRRILIEAFGERHIHFDLRLLPPLIKKKKKASCSHANFSDSFDLSQPYQWQWRGNVCHTMLSRWPDLPDPGDHFDGNKGDECYTGRANCRFWSKMTTTDCIIGAMGWLLTCRYAYIEGIEVLYRTNWLCIQGIHLFRQLPDLLLPQRYASITSLRLHWDLYPWPEKPQIRKNYDLPGSDMNEFHSMLETLPALVPTLRYLHLSLEGDMQAPVPLRERLKIFQEASLIAAENMLALIEPMLKKLDQLLSCQIALPSSYYRQLKFKEKGVGFGYEHRMWDPPIWRDLPVQNESLPNEGSRRLLRGYWLTYSVIDFTNPFDGNHDPNYVRCI
ncbi:hypothetical protein FQN57_002862 [Myotisia sp. PD_48]|nr:hypothetical protein FQN57_002862 [Myotisia sp. PD_48]